MNRIALDQSKSLLKNYNPVNNGTFDHQSRIISSALGIAFTPSNTKHLENLQNTSSYYKLQNLHERMNNSKSGKEILQLKPRVLKSAIDQDNLKQLPDNTFGKVFQDQMEKKGFDINDRHLTTEIPDLRYAQVLQRLIEVHDFHHLLLGLDTSVEEELLVKLFEFRQTNLPANALACMFGWVPLGLHCLDKPDILQTLRDEIPKVIHVSQYSRFTLKIQYERMFDWDIQDVRRELRIVKIR